MEGREGPRSSFTTVAGLVSVPILGLAVFFAWNWAHGGATPEQAMRLPDGSAVEGFAPPAPPPLEEADEASALPKIRKRHRGDIVLIIDDLGFDGQPLEKVMALDPNVNCSILPNGTRAEAAAELLHARGFEILCHLPMEPRGGASPGRNAILTSMEDDEIARLTRENVGAIPHARGVNNHMGSRATTDRRVMTTVLSALPEGLYFIDSRTTGGSIAATIAREKNVRTATRHVFLDDVANEKAVRRQLASLASYAERRGVAIGIAHPYDVTLRVLAEELPELRSRGFRLVRASEVVR